MTVSSSPPAVGFARHALILGFLSLVGPLAIDMYVPSLPRIAVELQATTASVQTSLSVFFLAMALCQMAYGPAADILGRKRPMYFGLILYAVASLGCALAPNISVLIALRFVQGIGACAAVVITRAVVRDLHTGLAAARLMSLIMLVFAISPMVAPLLGSSLAAVFGWRAIFWVNAIMGAIGFLVAWLLLEETRPEGTRSKADVGAILRTCGLLLRDRHYMGLVLIGSLGLASFFAFLSSSSFVYIDHFGLSQIAYSIAFSCNAIGFFAASQLTATIGRRVGLRALVRVSQTAAAILLTALLVLFVAGVDNFWVMVTFLFVGFGCLGFVIPSSSVLALEAHGAHAGMAAALLGTLQTAVGVVSTAVAGLVFNGTAVPMLGVIAGCVILAFLIAQITLRKNRVLPA